MTTTDRPVAVDLAASPPTVGRVVQVSVSPGGVPKSPVSEARVGPLGLEGDGHAAFWTHGGPLRAVCLFAIEAIERVRAEGHPIAPGSTGENLTTAGIELARLPIGTRLAVGAEVLLEVTSPAMPCETITGSFRDRKSGRISILLHPDDSRVYARVLREGVVRAGDPIRVLPSDPESDAPTHDLLSTLDRVQRHSFVARWAAAEKLGYAIDWVADGDLVYAISRQLEGPLFNAVRGMRVVPNLLPMVLERFEAAGATPWIDWPADAQPPWGGAEPAFELEVHVASPAEVAEAGAADGFAPGVGIREIGPDEADAWVDAAGPAAPPGEASAEAWRRTTPLVAATAGHHLFLAELDGRAVGAGLLVRRGRAALIRAGAVHPLARGRGIQRAMIAARAACAAEHGCDLLTSEAEPGSISARNLAAMGFTPIARGRIYRYDRSRSGGRESSSPA